MSKREVEPVYAYCQSCRQKTEMTQDYVTSTGKVRTLRGKCSVGHDMQLVVSKEYRLP